MCPNHSQDHFTYALVRATVKHAFPMCTGSTLKKLTLLDHLVRVPWRVERDHTKRVHVETHAFRENAVTQEYRMNASVSRVRPCQPHSVYRLNLIAASFSGHCFATNVTVCPIPRSRSRALQTPDMGSMLLRPWTTNCLKCAGETKRWKGERRGRRSRGEEEERRPTGEKWCKSGALKSRNNAVASRNLLFSFSQYKAMTFSSHKKVLIGKRPFPIFCDVLSANVHFGPVRLLTRVFKKSFVVGERDVWSACRGFCRRRGVGVDHLERLADRAISLGWRCVDAEGFVNSIRRLPNPREPLRHEGVDHHFDSVFLLDHNFFLQNMSSRRGK